MPFNTKPIGFAYDDMRLNGSALVNVPTIGADVGIGIGGGVNAAAAIEYSGTFPTDANNTFLSLVSGTIPSGSTGIVRMYSSQPNTAAASFTLTTLQHFWAAQGTLGAGSAITTQVGFLANSSLTGATNNYGFQGSIAAGTGRYNFYASGSADNYFAGSVGIGAAPSAGIKTRVGGTLPTTSSNTFALEIDGTVPSGTTSSARIFRSAVGTEAASFTLSSLAHFTVNQGTFGAGSAVTNQYGFLVQSDTTGATNNYGFFSDLAAASGRWNFYAAGTADNYFAGNTGIGTTTPGEKLEVNGAIKTAAPAGGTAASWKLGAVATVSPTSPNRTIEVDIGGTIYYLHAKTTND